MDHDSAVAFLRANRPLPRETELSDADAATFDEVRRFFIANPDPTCIPLFLQAFGDGMGFGVYQMSDEVFRCYDQSQLTPHMVDALKSDRACTRWWAAHWALDFPDPAMLDALRQVAGNSHDADAHYFALAAIGKIWQSTRDADARRIIEQRRENESEPELLELCEDILKS